MQTIHKFSHKWSIYLVLIATLFTGFTFFTSCNDDDDDFSPTGTNLSIADIAGNWMATSATFTAPEFTDILEDGASVLLNIENNGRFTFTIKRPGEVDEVTTGKLGFDGEFLAVRFDDDPDDEASFFISLINDILTLRGQTELDLDENGVDDFGILELIMERM